MTYAEAIQFLYGLRLFGAKFGLENTLKLAALAGQPQDRLRFIHVAGTNGKGSTCAMLESIYRTAGLRTGLFTSPHLVSFRERIQVNRRLISEQDVVRLVGEIQTLQSSAGVPPASVSHPDKTSRRDACATFFEVVTVMALKFFAEQKCDLVIWETGLGGRLDATNIVTPLASVITNIALDHEQWLGDTLAKIAAEKAGAGAGRRSARSQRPAARPGCPSTAGSTPRRCASRRPLSPPQCSPRRQPPSTASAPRHSGKIRCARRAATRVGDLDDLPCGDRRAGNRRVTRACSTSVRVVLGTGHRIDPSVSGGPEHPPDHARRPGVLRQRRNPLRGARPRAGPAEQIGVRPVELDGRDTAVHARRARDQQRLIRSGALRKIRAVAALVGPTGDVAPCSQRDAESRVEPQQRGEFESAKTPGHWRSRAIKTRPVTVLKVRLLAAAAAPDRATPNALSYVLFYALRGQPPMVG